MGATMKCCRAVLLTLVSLPAVLSAADTGWVTIFSEDFNGSALDADKWSKYDYVNWNVADWRKFQSQDDALYKFGGDTLTLWGRYGDYTSQSDPTGAANGYACAGLNTQGKFSFQYGKVEVRAKFDSVQGVWPAIWMLPSHPVSWLGSGEIDLMEHLNYEGSAHQTLHYTANNGSNASSYTTVNKAYSDLHVGDKTQWHTYGVEWKPDAITFSIDGIETATFSSAGENNWPFDADNSEFYLIIDQQIGGSWVEGLGDTGINQTRLAGAGAAFEIDSVRVYTASAMKSGTSFTNNGVTVSAASDTTLSGTAGAADFAATNADIAVAADAKGNVSLKGTFNNCRVVNANGKATLTVDACASSARNKVEATGGDITFINAGDSMMVSGLTIGEDRTVAAYKAIDELEAYESTIILAANTGASFAEGSTLLANLTVYNGNTLTFDGALTLGSSLTLWDRQKLAITAAGADPDSAAFLLFDSVESLTLRGSGTDALADGRYDAASVFSTITVGGQSLTVADYDLMYKNGQVSLLSKNLIPEPATATLSLLALAGLLTRRRRS